MTPVHPRRTLRHLRRIAFLIGVTLAQTGIAEPGQPSVSEGTVQVAPGIELSYRSVGSGSPAVIVPGGSQLWKDFLPLAESHRLVFYDTRNRGRSSRVRDPEKLTIEADLADLEALREALGLESVSIIGYSYMGKLAAMYALAHLDRVERIVQIGPVSMKFGTEYPEEHAVRDPREAMDAEKLAALRALREAGLHESDPKKYCEEEWELTKLTLVGDPTLAGRLDWRRPCENPNDWPTRLAFHMTHHFASTQKAVLTPDDVADIEVPVLVVHGLLDRNAAYGSGREWAARLPNARLVTVEDAAHAAWISRESVIPAIGRFLSGAWPQEAEILPKVSDDG